MPTIWLSYSIILLITVGFAGLLGELGHRLREKLTTPFAALSILTFGMVVLPPLNLPGILPWLFWASAFSTFVVYFVRPTSLPQVFATRRFAMRFIAITMLLCALWYLMSTTGFPAIMLSSGASVTAGKAWVEG